MHVLDRAAAVSMSRTPPQRRVFRNGWGDPDVLDWYIDQIEAIPPVATIDVRARPARRQGSVFIRDLEYESPADFLPDAVRTARARLISPHPVPDRLVILHASWNDHGFRHRGLFARQLLARGVATLMPEHPFYGSRSPADDGAMLPIGTVAEFGQMARAAVLEGRALARHFHERGHVVCSSGYSMGGNIGAFVATLVDFPVAAAPLAAPYSPAAPFLHGLLRNSISWDALGGDTPEVEARLFDFLDEASILRFAPAPHTRAAVIIAATRDGFVPTASVQAIHRHWPGSEMRWENAGHGSMLWRRRRALIEAVMDSFERFEALTA